MQTSLPAANQLAKERSPYLQQHADNPVDWYPWGEAALDRAKVENKPILLSVGYSACHWCHVMAHESFSDLEIAGLMNEHFVSIKVDREERPDIDKIYQEACHLLTRQGGWPLTVFLTPELEPFYAGTYFPPKSRWGRPGFKEILASLSETYQSKTEQLTKLAKELAEAMADSFAVREPAETTDLARRLSSLARSGRENLFRHFDQTNGGLGGAPKFPSVPNLEYFWTSKDQEHKAAVEFTLSKMVAGGIYDQIGGGFHRYATDEIWLIPHFEKMLYDNALLLSLLSRVYRDTGNESLRQAARATADYILREMTGPQGEFFTSQDADVNQEEGAFYVWTPGEISAALGQAEADAVIKYFGVTEQGNFEDGTSVLYRTKDGSIPSSIQSALEILLQTRESRERPGRDEKVLTGWNGLMLGALALCGKIFGEERYIQAAENNVSFLTQNLFPEESYLLRSYLDGPSTIPGFLDDYAFFTAGLLDLFDATAKRPFLDLALKLQKILVDRFADPTGGFFLSEADLRLLLRPKEITDEAVPSGAAVALVNMLRLTQAAPELANQFQGHLSTTFGLYLNQAAENPWGHATFLRAGEVFAR